MSDEFFDIFKKPYWQVPVRHEGANPYGYIYTDEAAAFDAADEYNAYPITRYDPDGTKTVIE